MHQITITGVPLHPGDIAGSGAPRREINDLIRDEKQFSLYVQALRKLSLVMCHCDYCSLSI